MLKSLTSWEKSKNRWKIKPRNDFNNKSIYRHLEECKKYFKKYEKYEEITCARSDRTVGVFNLWPNISRYHLEKYFYRAKQAHESYPYTLKGSRQCIGLTTSEINRIVTIIKPLFKKGHSIYQILTNHPKISIVHKILYSYIENGIFKDYGIDSFTLKRYSVS